MKFFRKTMLKFLYNHTDATRQRLVLRNWGGVSDINILSKALQTETFRSYVKHTIYETQKNKRYLVLAPHQDDELIGAGGLLLKARNIGAESAICFLTNGAQKNLVLSGKKYPPESVVELRKKEALKVCNRLDARFHELHIDNITMETNHNHITELENLIKDFRPDVVLSPWIFDGSAKHRMANQILYHALEKVTPSTNIEIWGYQVNNPIFSNIAVDITKEICERSELLSVYKSQNIGIKNYAHLSEGLAAWNSRYLPSKKAEGEKQYAELFMTIGSDDFKYLIENYYLPNLNNTYFGSSDLAKNMTSLV